MTKADEYILAGDIGGTKTELALYPVSAAPRSPVFKKRYPSHKYGSLEKIVTEFLSEGDFPLLQASFGVAGPVLDNKAKITNLPWSIDSQTLSKEIGAPVELINDMDAIAHAVGHIGREDMATIHAGEPDEHGARGIIAPGTGLGEGFLVWVEDHYQPFGTEGGHTDFAPRSPLQVELLQFLEKRFDHVSFERVCSGMGIPNLYAFFKETGRYPEPDWLGAQLEQAGDKTPLIVQTAQAGKAEICTAVLDLFVDILGNEAGNLALKILATGGVYLAGGIPPRILDWMKKPAFERSFMNKGRFSEILSRIPLHVVMNPDAGLIGAAWNGFIAAGVSA